ncbi:hypothetical protein GLYMA_08G143050v4 [Glycine max]|nr:hypothetical protein GLYMA_08G143050v4 [Glycine max]KAH1051193.1 hypothetical protein GYH30_021228 [Glycine max]
MPTDGDKNANDKNANRFYQGFLKKMASNKGTLLHPGPVNSYLVSLFDENMKSVAPDDFERHWGIFHYDGKPEFPIDFSGKGEDKMPIGAKGVRYQEQKWCVLKSNANRSELGGYLSYACAGGDCTSLGNLDASGNASYAFNQYFQINDQSVEACDFEGVATIASKENVFFPCINHQ